MRRIGSIVKMEERSDLMKKACKGSLFLFCTVALFVCGLTGTAAASTMNIDDLVFLYKQGNSQSSTYVLKDQVDRYDLDNGNPLAAFHGVYEFIYLGYEAGYTNILAEGSDTIFNNKASSVFSTGSADFGTAVFNNPAGGLINVALTGTAHLDIYKAAGSFLKEVTGNNWFADGKEYYIIGFNDGYTGDKDYDDFVVAIDATAMHTPIPSAALLLGSGIIGLAGFGLRRRRSGK